MAIAASKNYERAREGLFQDVLTWRRRGWVDEIFPMTYARDNTVFSQDLRGVLSAGDPGRVCPGIGVYLHKDSSQLRSQVDLVRRMGAGGYALFALSNFYPTKSHESSNDSRSEALRSEMRETIRRLNGGTSSARVGK